MRVYIPVTSGACVCLPTPLRTVIGLGEWEWVRLRPDGDDGLRLEPVETDEAVPRGVPGAAYLDVPGDA
jgi:hypothetical protein